MCIRDRPNTHHLHDHERAARQSLIDHCRAMNASGLSLNKSGNASIRSVSCTQLEVYKGQFQLTMLGIGAIIGTGIFVLTAEPGQKAGPAMMVAFVIAAVVCALAALAYTELASMVPVLSLIHI